MQNKNIQTEIDSSFLYQKLAENESDKDIADVFFQMSQIEKGHAEAFANKEKIDITQLMKPSNRAKILNLIGRIFSYGYVLDILMETEKGLSTAIVRKKKKDQKQLTGTEDNHVKILQSVLVRQSETPGKIFRKLESRHRSIGGNALRAAVLGGNDGLVSNFSLIMGVAGATNDANNILLAGIAGLLAGALSMSLGEWISVKNSQELHENQMQIEMEELETNPAGEMQELLLIYKAKGIPEEQAKTLAEKIMANKEQAHAILVKEELGLDSTQSQGSAAEAAIYSFLLFSLGAIIPILPYFFLVNLTAMLISISLSALGLFLIGATITLYTGRNVWFSGFRQVLFGLTAAAITFGIGKIIGVTLVG